MKRDREELIDFLLGELPPERARAWADRIADDPAAAAEHARLAGARDLIRDAAAEGWGSGGRARVRWLRPAVAAAAVVLVSLAFLLTSNGAAGEARVFEPARAFGYLRPEETGRDGGVPVPARGDAIVLRHGAVEVGALGSDRSWPLDADETVPPGSELRCGADSGARLDLPHGGILFLGPLATVQLRARDDGQSAVRLLTGSAAVVAGDTPVHLAVEDTDLLLVQRSGATLLRGNPAEAINLRGALTLKTPGGGTFDVPPGERLPAACATEPRTEPAADGGLELDWYRSLIYRDYRVEDVAWAAPGRSRPLDHDEDALLFLRLVPERSGIVRVSFGAGAREFPVAKGAPLELRLRLAGLGPGPQLEVTPADGLREARVFEATPR